jgi:hypothetical protein
MGDRFSEVVVACLESGRRAANRSAEMDKRDQEDEGLRIGLRYIETVLDSLDRISL